VRGCKDSKAEFLIVFGIAGLPEASDLFPLGHKLVEPRSAIRTFARRDAAQIRQHGFWIVAVHSAGFEDSGVSMLGSLPMAGVSIEMKRESRRNGHPARRAGAREPTTNPWCARS
jgi:hypothetical protein